MPVTGRSRPPSLRRALLLSLVRRLENRGRNSVIFASLSLLVASFDPLTHSTDAATEQSTLQVSLEALVSYMHSVSLLS